MAPSKGSKVSDGQFDASYHPGEDFMQMKPKSFMDLKGDDKEVWLLRIPLEVDLNDLNGMKVHLEKAKSNGVMGRMDLGNGPSSYELVSDHPSLASQLYTLSCQGGSKLGAQKIQRHVSLLPAVQETAQEIGAFSAAGTTGDIAIAGKKDKFDKKGKSTEAHVETKEKKKKKDKEKNKKEKKKQKDDYEKKEDTSEAQEEKPAKQKKDKKKEKKKGEDEVNKDKKDKKRKAEKDSGEESEPKAKKEKKAEKKKKKKSDKGK